MQPQLEESTRQTEAAMEVIAKETEEADKVKKVGPGYCYPAALREAVPLRTGPVISMHKQWHGCRWHAVKARIDHVAMGDHHRDHVFLGNPDQYVPYTRCDVDKACMA